jgi:hypothetical protein
MLLWSCGSLCYWLWVPCCHRGGCHFAACACVLLELLTWAILVTCVQGRTVRTSGACSAMP